MKKKIAIALNLVILSAVITSVPQAIASECSPGDPCGTWAMLDSQGVVTNIIVCQASVCGGGTWAGQTVVPQVAPNPVTNQSQGGFWGTYDSSTKEFTVDRNGPNQTPAQTQTNSETRVETNSEGAVVSTTKIETMSPAVAKTFKYEDTIKNPNDVSKDGEPDLLEFDIHFVRNDKGIKLLVNISYGDNMACEFTIETPNKINVGHYTGIGSIYDPKTHWGFKDETILDLVEFLYY